ncbi:hypothetical protein Tco_1530459 [Tanacetum coccineum]
MHTSLSSMHIRHNYSCRVLLFRPSTRYIRLAEMVELRETDRRRQAQIIETLRVMRNMRREMSDMHAELLAHREQKRRARQPRSDARAPDHQDASRDADSHI